MDPATLQVFQQELTCPICMNFFLDPVRIDCGHNFCRSCLSLSWEEAKTPMCCPMCRAREAGFCCQTGPMEPGHQVEEQVPGEQTEAAGLLTEVDKSLHYQPLSGCPQPEIHDHTMMECAAEESREKLLKEMNTLWELIQELKNNVTEEIKKTHSFKEYVSLRELMIKAQYQKLRIFLHEEEQLQLQALHREAQEISQQLQGSEMRMTQQKHQVINMYRELAEVCHKPDMELLQDMRSVLERAELVQTLRLQGVNPELTLQNITGLREMLNNFRVDNGLRREVARRYVSFSEDLRRTIFGEEHRSAPNHSQRAESFAVWGTQTFTSGQHYWEVDVSSSSNWILGVCYDSSTSDTSNIIHFEEAFLLASLKSNNHYVLYTSVPPLTHYVKRPLSMVGVFLDCDHGTVGFYDVDKGSLIHCNVPTQFTSPLNPLFWLGPP
ncbi:tripartite motif-containing protein 64-like [Oryctolagus cuniculus]|uniref:tripartite motif-containing protein 64-like n=1 Tax=Oryctolagus cuniculus TaxID=9986 RepID=UPI0038791F06